MLEKLFFSLSKLLSFLDNPDNLDDDGNVVRTYYLEEEFNERIPLNSLLHPKFLDAQEIFSGVVDNSKVSIKKQTPDELAEELFVEVKALS